MDGDGLVQQIESLSCLQVQTAHNSLNLLSHWSRFSIPKPTTTISSLIAFGSMIKLDHNLDTHHAWERESERVRTTTQQKHFSFRLNWISHCGFTVSQNRAIFCSHFRVNMNFHFYHFFLFLSAFISVFSHIFSFFLSSFLSPPLIYFFLIKFEGISEKEIPKSFELNSVK